MKTLVDELHRATDRCIPIWRGEFKESLETCERIRQDCRLLLGELLKLAVSMDRVPEQLGELAYAAPQRIMLSCRRIGTAVTIYCALRDLPLLFSDVIDEGFDVSSNSVINLGGLRAGVGSDARDDLYEGLWRAVRGKPTGLKAWTANHLDSLKKNIDLHWSRDRKWYLLITELSDAGDASPAYDHFVREMSIGLVLRSATEQCDLLNIDEEELIVRACQYLELLETL